MNRPHARSRDESGAVAVVTALLIVLLLVVSAFSIDVGLAYASRMELRTAADSGALAAAGVFAETEDIRTCEQLRDDAALSAQANAAAQAIAGDNYADSGIAAVNPGNIVVECVNDGTNDGLKVSMSVTGDTDTFFGQLAGAGGTIESTTTAAALVDVPPEGTGLRPLALCSSYLPSSPSSVAFRVDGPKTGSSSTPAIDMTDSDGGGVSDATEQDIPGNEWKKNPETNKDDDLPAQDDDLDGLTRAQESAAGTHPLNPDTDGDGLRDGVDPEPLVAAGDCPELADPGNWWTVQCPNDTGNKDLAAAILSGCDDPLEIVRDQGSKTGADLSSHLISRCNPDTVPANCLEADTGQINGNPVLTNFDSLIANQTPFVLPVFCGPPTPCDPVAIRGAETGTGRAGSNTDYPIYRMIGVTLCDYSFDQRDYVGGCGPNGAKGENFVMLKMHSVMVSGVTGPSICSLGAGCDGGLRRVQLIE